MSKRQPNKLKAEPLVETSSVPMSMYPDTSYEQDPSVHAPKVPDLKKPKPQQNPDKGFLREVLEESGADDMVLTQPIRYIVDPKDAIEKMEALNRKVEESRPDLAQQVAVVDQAIQQLEQGADGQGFMQEEVSEGEVPAFNEGDRVSVTLEDGVYEGMVETANEDGTFAVRTDQAMTLQNVPPTSMQKIEVQQMSLPASLRMRLQAARMVTDAIAKAFIEGKKRSIANTSTDGQTVWLHNNPIVRKAADGSVEVSLAGLPTATTRERINGILNALGLDGRVSQRGGSQMLNGKPWDGEWTSVGPAVDIEDHQVIDENSDPEDPEYRTEENAPDPKIVPTKEQLKKAGLTGKKVKAATTKRPKKGKKAEEPAEEMEACDDCGAELDPEKGEVFLTDDGGTYCADCFANHEGEGDDDENNREPDPEMDIVIGDDDLSAYYAGKEIVSISREDADEDEDALEKAVAAWMDKNNYWPDVWTISDHGNSNIVTERFFKFTKGAKGDEKALKAMLSLNSAVYPDDQPVTIGDIVTFELDGEELEGNVKSIGAGDNGALTISPIKGKGYKTVIFPEDVTEHRPGFKAAEEPAVATAPAEAGAKQWFVVERKWSDGNDARPDGDLLVEADSVEAALDLAIAAANKDFKEPAEEEDGDERTHYFMWSRGYDPEDEDSGWTETYTLTAEGPFATEEEARKNTSKFHGTPVTLEAGMAIGTGEGRLEMIAGKKMGKKAPAKVIAKLKASRVVKAAEPTNTAQSGTEKGKVKSGYEPTGIQVVEEGGKPRVFDGTKDDVVPAELYKNEAGKFALVNPNGENTYEEGANDELEISYWATVKSLAPAGEKPAEPEAAKTAEAPAQTKEAVAASAKATAIAAREKIKAAKKPAVVVKASAFDEIGEIEIGGGYKAKKKPGKEAKEGEESEGAEIEVVDADGKVKATYPDAFGDDTVMIIKFLRQVLDIKEGDDKKAAKKEGGDKKEGGESDIAEKPKALPATKEEKPKSETEKEEEQVQAKRMEARLENIRLIAVRLLKTGHIQANLDDVDEALVKPGMTLAGAQAVAAQKAVNRKVLDLLAQPEDELLLIQASLPLLPERRVTVHASGSGLGPINLSANGVIDVSGNQSQVGLGAAFGRGFRR